MKEVLEELKEELEEKKLYFRSDLRIVFNNETFTYEILFPKRSEKEHQNSTNIIYQNLRKEKIKIIKKNNYFCIIPRKYSLKNRNTIKEVFQKEFYCLEELKELENELNYVKVK